MNGGEAREATLDAVHSDQMHMQEQLANLNRTLNDIESHLMGGPHVQMLSAAAAQVAASTKPIGGLAAAGLERIPEQQPPLPGMLPQMCELGVTNSKAVDDLQSRLSYVSRILGVRGHEGGP